MKTFFHPCKVPLASIWIILFALFLTIPPVFADGGIVIGEKDGDGLRITIFAQPVPLRAGPADFSVLVQEIASRQPVMDADVRLSLKKLSAPSPEKAWAPPYCQVPGADGDIVLRHDLSLNKMLCAAMVAISEAGRWELSVTAVSGERRVVATLPLDVAAPRKPISTWWLEIAMMPATIALYAWRAYILRTRRNKSIIRPAESLSQP